MNREETIKYMESWENHMSDNGGIEEAEAFRMAIEALKDQIEPIICPRCGRTFATEEGREAAEALKAQEWIPCSERLPEEGEVVLTQAKFRDDIKMAVGARQDYNYWTGWGTREINILAWMPLPEPYKAESEDKK